MKNKLILHCHTSGLNYNSLNIYEGYQIISVGAIVLSESNKKVDQFEKYIVFNDKNKWDKRAHDIHGISRNKLMSIGGSEDSAYEEFVLFLADNFDVLNEKIQCIGYSIDTFTLIFIKKFLKDINIKFSYCNIDLKSLFCLEQNKSTDIKSFISFFNNKRKELIEPSSLEMCNLFYIAYRYYQTLMASSERK